MPYHLCKMPLLTLQQLQSRLKEFTYKDWDLNIYEGSFEGLQFEIKANMTDNFNPGTPFKFHCVSPLPPLLSIEQFDLYLLWRIKRIEIHECMENLKVKGEVFISPHREAADRDLLPEII
jgi:hypothetical protein